ncbi:MAG TPA: hypothetical protein DCZ69_17510 [Syntrophobacteraceae bacterium]|nr:hypothetical protein [Syntrophobacteraceae bacterium]HBD10052.1 hypothetical protein [Syntrophobacteraceae bacterium]
MTGRTTDARIAEALGLYAQYAQILEADTAFMALLSDYHQAIACSADRMLELGVASQCQNCARHGPGSCCSRGIEDWYDPMLLFVNLLLGCDLREVRPLPGDCHFVGTNGCTLIARHYFCVQFLCPAFKDQLGPTVVGRLLAVVGEELQRGWEVEQYLYRVFNSRRGRNGYPHNQMTQA